MPNKIKKTYYKKSKSNIKILKKFNKISSNNKE